MKGVLLFISLLIVKGSISQFLDLNLFKPRVVFDAEYQNKTQNNSLGYWKTGTNVLFPIKGKLNFDVDWKNVLTSSSIKEAISNVTPKAYQLFGEVGYKRHQYIQPAYFGNFDSYKVGVTGIWVKYKNKKVKTLFLSGNIRYTIGGDSVKSSSVVPTLFVGTSVVHSLKNFVVVGGYGSYIGDRLIGTPVLMWYHRYSKLWSSTLIFPAQAKLTWSLAGKFKQELVASYYGYSHGVRYFKPTEINQLASYSGVNAVTGLRISTQSKIRMGNGIDLYLEAGWQDLTQTGLINGYKLDDQETFDGSIFAKMRISIALGKALIKPNIFDFDL